MASFEEILAEANQEADVSLNAKTGTWLGRAWARLNVRTQEFVDVNSLGIAVTGLAVGAIGMLDIIDSIPGLNHPISHLLSNIYSQATTPLVNGVCEVLPDACVPATPPPDMFDQFNQFNQNDLGPGYRPISGELS